MRNPFATSQKDVDLKMQGTATSLEEVAAGVKAKKLGLPYVDLRSFPVDLNALSLFTRVEAETAEAVPFFMQGKEVRIGALNVENQLLQVKIASLSKEKSVHLYVISPVGLSYALKSYAKVVSPDSVDNTSIKVATGQTTAELIQKLNTGGSELRAGDIMAELCTIAYQMQASDIHLEPADKHIGVRFRVDGVLQSLVTLDKSLHKALIARLKLLSKLKFNVENMPQDGRFTFIYDQVPVDVRVSTLPSSYGEGVVLRLLGVGATNLKLDDLGLIGRSREIIEQELQKPNGFIVTTGPTGSGKTTTLYAFLNELNEPGVKIITIEDPVEYKISGIQQTPIDHSVDFSFAKALRAILRQDPDIVMVGEIRDTETAETAMQASLTGHIVLSTLHTNDSFGAIPRLLSMGVAPYVIAPAMNAIIAQRLVRRLCEKCKTAITLEGGIKEKVERVIASIPETAKVTLPEVQEFFHSPGCEACNNLGYKGRVGIYEVLHVNDAIKSLILSGASMLEMKKQAMLDGTLTMVQDGILKALNGLTDVEEVFRVAGE